MQRGGGLIPSTTLPHFTQIIRFLRETACLGGSETVHPQKS